MINEFGPGKGSALKIRSRIDERLAQMHSITSSPRHREPGIRLSPAYGQPTISKTIFGRPGASGIIIRSGNENFSLNQNCKVPAVGSGISTR